MLSKVLSEFHTKLIKAVNPPDEAYNEGETISIEQNHLTQCEPRATSNLYFKNPHSVSASLLLTLHGCAVFVKSQKLSHGINI